MDTYHAIIVGGGHNGLVTAAYLAGAGRRVLVLESRDLVGGCAVTEEIWPGYRVSTASYLASLMQEKVVRDLDLARFGYIVDAKDPWRGALGPVTLESLQRIREVCGERVPLIAALGDAELARDI
ncbi:MAG: FAD-dependent oxidoreductase, partial [Acidobacteriota bacterium]